MTELWPEITRSSQSSRFKQQSKLQAERRDSCPGPRTTETANVKSENAVALQNTNWLLVGLDIAHTNHALDTQQVAWLKSVVEKAGQRKLILFSHHRGSTSRDPTCRTRSPTCSKKKAITAWYWGHEHNCIIYDKHATFGLPGRCIGHGGIPSPRKREVVNAPAYRRLNGIAWKRLRAIPMLHPAWCSTDPIRW